MPSSSQVRWAVPQRSPSGDNVATNRGNAVTSPRQEPSVIPDGNAHQQRKPLPQLLQRSLRRSRRRRSRGRNTRVGSLPSCARSGRWLRRRRQSRRRLYSIRHPRWTDDVAWYVLWIHVMSYNRDVMLCYNSSTIMIFPRSPSDEEVGTVKEEQTFVSSRPLHPRVHPAHVSFPCRPLPLHSFPPPLFPSACSWSRRRLHHLPPRLRRLRLSPWCLVMPDVT